MNKRSQKANLKAEQKAMSVEQKDGFVMERLARIDEMDRSFDIEYWQRQDSQARFVAAWELVIFAHERQGKSADELRLQRTIEHLERRAG